MIEPTLNYVLCPDAESGHRMAYWQWGDPMCPDVVVCVHGLSRQGRDFDVLAQALCSKAENRIRVICPDVVGRGRSDWLKHPTDYQIPTYAADMLALLKQLQPQRLDWVGTSMGGLIGLVLAGQKDIPLPAPMRRLVLNDVGPVIEWQALQRIGEYLGHTGLFASEQEAADALWASSTTFGRHTPEQWLAFSRPMLKAVGDAKGSLTLHYDPAIAIPLAGVSKESVTEGEVMLWQLYDQISAATLLLRGAESDLLSIDTARAMTQRGPKARLLEFTGVGHAPTLIAEAQVQAVLKFLLD